MRLREWRPGTTKWAYFVTGFYVVAVAIFLPLTIVQGHETDWILLAFFAASGLCAIISAWLQARQQTSRRDRRSPGETAGRDTTGRDTTGHETTGHETTGHETTGR